MRPCLERFNALSQRQLVIEPNSDVVSHEGTEWLTSNESIEAEALSRVVEKKETVHQDEKDIPVLVAMIALFLLREQDRLLSINATARGKSSAAH